MDQDLTNNLSTTKVEMSSFVYKQNESFENKNEIVEIDNTWRRYFLIKWKIFNKFMVNMIPVSYFIIISFAGSSLGTRLFKKYIKPALNK
jgi:hypothetical protein